MKFKPTKRSPRANKTTDMMFSSDRMPKSLKKFLVKEYPTELGL
tara:strand:- start:1522 stop:1653 length:132 start_codon:yes stop_codon:yes gene_type:complete